MLHLLEVQSRGRDLEDGLVVDLDGVGVCMFMAHAVRAKSAAPRC